MHYSTRACQSSFMPLPDACRLRSPRAVIDHEEGHRQRHGGPGVQRLGLAVFPTMGLSWLPYGGALGEREPAFPGWRPSAVRPGGRDRDAGLPRSPWVWNPARVTVRLMAVRAMKAAVTVTVTLAIATGCHVQGGQPARIAPAVPVSCRTPAASAIADSAAFDAAHPGASPQPVLTMPHLVATRPVPAYSPGAPSDQAISLFADPDDARYVYRLGPHGLSLIDAATWAVRWTTAIPVPRSFGASL